MLIFNYHPGTGEYLSTTEARPDPMVEGGHLIPAHATKKVVPEVSDPYKKAFFDVDADAWEVVADYRGQTLYSTVNGEPLQVVDLGIAPDESTFTATERQPFEYWVEGAWVKNEDEALAVAKGAKLLEIKTAADNALTAITKYYPEKEQLSWDKQEAEARAFVADENALTPLVDSIAAARDYDKLALCNMIIGNADTFATVSGAVFGKRQVFTEQLVAGLTVADIDNIIVSFE